MGRTGSDGRTERTASSLRQALLRLLETRRFDDITIKDIVDEAQVGVATFYRHFATKAALLQAVADVEIHDLVDMAVELLRTSGSRSSSLSLVAHVGNRRALWSVLLSGGAAAEMRQGFARRLAVAYSQEEKILAGSWLPTDLGIAFGAAAMIEIIVWWLAQNEEVSPAQVAQYLELLAIHPALTSPPQPQLRVTFEGSLSIDGLVASSISGDLIGNISKV